MLRTESASIVMIKRLVEGAIPGNLDLWFGVVDVRDVASLHLKAMTDPLSIRSIRLPTAPPTSIPVGSQSSERPGRTAR